MGRPVMQLTYVKAGQHYTQYSPHYVLWTFNGYGSRFVTPPAVPERHWRLGKGLEPYMVDWSDR